MLFAGLVKTVTLSLFHHPGTCFPLLLVSHGADTWASLEQRLQTSFFLWLLVSFDDLHLNQLLHFVLKQCFYHYYV